MRTKPITFPCEYSLIFPHCVVVCTDSKQQSHNLRVLTGTLKTYSYVAVGGVGSYFGTEKLPV